jgi:hypothetical protein
LTSKSFKIFLGDEPKYVNSNTFFVINNHDKGHKISCHTSLMTAFMPPLRICLVVYLTETFEAVWNQAIYVTIVTNPYH